MFTDLYQSEIPWDIIIDDSGKVIGEVYKVLPDLPPRRLKAIWKIERSPQQK